MKNYFVQRVEDFTVLSSVQPCDNQGEVIAETECHFCHRLSCAQCHVSWHPGISCEEYQKLNEDERGREDLMVRNFAKENKWRRCPKCHIIVERTQGCLHYIYDLQVSL